MISVDRIAGCKFTSNVYLISHTFYQNKHYLIDAGCIEDLVTILHTINSIEAVFLTHSHYDHIHDLNLILEKFPDLNIYCSDKTLIGLQNPKINLSYYHGNPIICKAQKYEAVTDNDEIPIFSGYASAKVIETPGHTNDSISFMINDYIFTGDALIPNYAVVTKLRTGDKNIARNSVQKIKCNTNQESILCPGHFEAYSVDKVDWSFYE